MNHKYCAKYKNVKLRPLERNDIEQLRVWRNDYSKTKYLRKIELITPEKQLEWYESYLSNPDEIIFSIIETQQLKRIVGSIALYNFKDGQAEVGKIQIGDDNAHGMGIGKISLVMASLIGFQKLGLTKVVSSVHQNNIAAHKNNMKVGFRIVGNHPAPMGGIEDEIEIDKERLLKINSYVPYINIENCCYDTK